jgi:WD40 repeat protein
VTETTHLDRLVNWIKNNKFLAVVILAAIIISAVSQFAESVVRLVQIGRGIVSSTQPAGATSTKHKTLTFGGKGTGPGLFTDARNIAIDHRGRVVIVEWMRGRVQQFEPDGKFVGQWSIPLQEYDTVSGISVDSTGTLYVASGKDVWRYEEDTGKLLGKLTFDKKDIFEVTDVKTTPDGGVVLSWNPGGFDNYLVLFDSNHRVRRTLKNVLKPHLEGLIFNDEPDHLAIDGLGNIYVAARGGVAVFKFSADGEFLNRFGSDGVEPGQLHNLQAIAANGKGDVFVSDVSGVQVFDGSGRFLRRIDMEDWAMGMAFNNAGQLYAITDNNVIRFDSP